MALFADLTERRARRSYDRNSSHLYAKGLGSRDAGVASAARGRFDIHHLFRADELCAAPMALFRRLA